MPKWIITVMGEGKEVFEGTHSQALERAHEIWLDEVDQDYSADKYTKEAAEEAGLEEDEE